MMMRADQSKSNVSQRRFGQNSTYASRHEQWEHTCSTRRKNRATRTASDQIRATSTCKLMDQTQLVTTAKHINQTCCPWTEPNGAVALKGDEKKWKWTEQIEQIREGTHSRAICDNKSTGTHSITPREDGIGGATLHITPCQRAVLT